ncbi:MAG: hypothetical protein ABI543_03550 [Ignavibacteria bacterium]
MSKFKTTFSICIMLFIFQCISANVMAGDRWKVTEIKTNGALKLHGDDWLFKIKIKNTGDKRSKGESISVTMKIYSDGTLISTKDITIQPDPTASGDTFSFDLGDTATHEFLVQNQNIDCVIQDNSSLDGMTETFTVQGKGR